MLEGCTPWPEATAAFYREQGYWRSEVLGDLLRSAPADAVAVVTPAAEHTYGELSVRADRLAAGLLARGLRPRDRVLVQLPNGTDLITLMVALFRVRAVPVLTITGLRARELNHVAAHTGARFAVLPGVWQGFDHRSLAAGLAAAGSETIIADGSPGLAGIDAEPVGLPRADPADVAFFLLSGGTTSLPKLIPRTHDDYAYQIRATAAAVGLGRDGAYLAALPAAHNAALGCPGVLGALRAGARVLLAPSPATDDAFPLLSAAGTAGTAGVVVTTLMPSLVPVWTEAARLSGARFPRLVVEVGGARIDPARLRDFEAVTGARTTRWFGMAEGPLSFTRPHDPDGPRLSGEGFPLSLDDEYLVVDAAGRPCAPGESGELLVRGPTTLRGYYREPDHNKLAFTTDGFLRTGDLADLDAEGNLTIRDRITDVVNRGGEKVPSGLVESLLVRHPAVRACAVAGVPDAVLTEKVAAFVVPDGAPPVLADLVEHLIGHGLAPHCVPEHLVLLDALPMTQLGKVDKKALVAAHA